MEIGIHIIRQDMQSKNNTIRVILKFWIHPPFWGVGQKFGDPVLDSKYGWQESIDDVRDGGYFYIYMNDLHKIDKTLAALIENKKSTADYLKNRKFSFSREIKK